MNVPPVLLVNVVVPALRFVNVPPVTLTSVGRFKYVVADIVSLDVVPVTLKLPLTVSPVTVLNKTE